MHRDSPLLKRAREKSSKKSFSIPRKGRIRFFLILILCTIGVWFSRSCVSNGVQPPEKELHTQPVKKEGKVQKSKKKESPKPISKKKLERSKLLSKEDVTDLFVHYPPGFDDATDLISLKKRSLRIHYSIDSTLQRIGKKFFKRYHPKYGAIVAMEPHTGRILSLVSYTREGEVSIGRRLYCSNIFPAASIFKTITAAAGIEKAGLKGDTPLKMRGSNHTLYLSQLKPELDPFREVPFQDAFAYSINPLFGRIGIFMLGPDGLQEYALKFGFNASIPFELKNMRPLFVCPDTGFATAEVASGFNKNTCISPLFGAMIAACVSHEGKMYAPTIVDSVADNTSKERRYTRERKLWRLPVQPETVVELKGLMKKVARYGTARKSFRYIKQSNRFKEMDYGGKTGNVDKDEIGKVDWFVGFCRHKSDKDQHVAVGVVTVHDAYWTVHSSYLGAEVMRKYIRRLQIEKKKNLEGPTG